MCSKAVAKKEDQLPSDWGDYAGAGWEDTTTQDLAVPFISLLQSNSPQVEEDNPKGSKSGMFFNTVTKELYDGKKGVVVVPVHKETLFVEWTPREAGGGLQGFHTPDSDAVRNAIANNNGNRFGKLPFGANELIETHYVYVLVLNDEGTEVQGFAVVSFTSTKIKPQKDWFTAMYLLRGKPPLFANRARLVSTPKQNKKGKFYNIQAEPLKGTWADSLLKPSDEVEKKIMDQAVEFRSMIASGQAKADFSQERATQGEGDDAAEGDIPF